MSTTPLTLSFAGQQPPIALPQVPGTRGPVGVDMRGLNQSGFCSYDPGFANTAGCQSAISWIDTENSVLLHRGYPVDQLARQCDFLEVAYIMLNGDAPDEASYQTFRETITRHTLVHEQIARMCSGFRRDSHPMALLSAERWTVGRVTVLSLFTTVQVFSMTSPLKVTLPSAACAATGESIIITTKDAIPLLYFFIFTPHHHAYGESFRKYPWRTLYVQFINAQSIGLTCYLLTPSLH